jgi:hypothetical protein
MDLGEKTRFRKFLEYVQTVMPDEKSTWGDIDLDNDTMQARGRRRIHRTHIRSYPHVFIVALLHAFSQFSTIFSIIRVICSPPV